jgi:hypothetical protein
MEVILPPILTCGYQPPSASPRFCRERDASAFRLIRHELIRSPYGLNRALISPPYPPSCLPSIAYKKHGSLAGRDGSSLTRPCLGRLNWGLNGIA